MCANKNTYILRYKSIFLNIAKAKNTSYSLFKNIYINS